MKETKVGSVKIIDAVWYGLVGVILGYDEITHLYHGYIGVGKGEDEVKDIINIVNWGERINKYQTMSFFPNNEDIKYVQYWKS